MDFYRIKERKGKGGVTEVYPDFTVTRSKDLMIRGRAFYAIWDEEEGLWSTDEYDVQRLVDQTLNEYAEKVSKRDDGPVKVMRLSDFSSSSWLQYRNYVGHLADSSHQLDENLTFSNTEVKKEDYVSRKLPYPLQKGSIAAYDELMATLYSKEERQKLEWAVGAIVAGDAKYIQKFVVLYGPAGAGKSTFLNIVQKLFAGYYTTFEAKALTSNSNAFSTEVFKSNPLVAIQHDGDLSRIEDNTKLNSIISHEEMTMNEKYKPSYMARSNSFLFMGTNKPVKITDAKSGIIRRLIDVQPSGEKLPPKRYQALYSQLDFELGAIANHCLEVYRSMGKDYYVAYRPVEMMLQTDVFFNFIEANFDVFKEQDGVTLNQAHEMYKQFCDETLVEFKLPRYKFREELKNYFHNFEERAVIDGVRVRSWYSGFITDHLTVSPHIDHVLPISLDHTDSVFDAECAEQPAQYASSAETPLKKWAEVETTLKDIDTSKLHYVKPPMQHIVIDFDLKDDKGDKSAERNLEAANKWPPTYAEFSKGGGGIHLHYIYAGDVSQLSSIYEVGIEVKKFVGDASLRRKLSKCNNLPIATLNGGLPLKEKKKMLNADRVLSEKGLRDLVEKNLRKEFHPGTKPSIDFIHKILEDAYNDGLQYDLTDMKNKIIGFANNSTNQPLYCLKVVQNMKFKSDEAVEPAAPSEPTDDRIVFFDVEVFPNLFLISWKFRGSPNVVRMINPKPHEVEQLTKLKLVGYNNRRYDNHILYGAILGYDNAMLYKLSKKIISGAPNALFGEAYDLSFADIYDFASKKQGLKKWQIELGIHHKELGFDWDSPVDEEFWELVGEYCDNDVVSTEDVFEHLEADFAAREILAELSGLSVNSTTQMHTAKIIFGDDRNPQAQFIYTDLSQQFEGYSYENGKSTYKGVEVGEGGYVYAEPGMYENVVELDIASMHPTSIEMLDLFGPYTKNFVALKNARLAIKHGDFETAGKMLNGALKPYLKRDKDAEKLSYALKIVINIVYGLTAAKFDNKFKDPRNKDNIVAKRGALFMVDLKEFVEKQGVQVIHIKTDSIKIAIGDSKGIIDDIMEFGDSYGYTFEHDATFEKFCLVNDAVYIAKTAAGREPSHWKAVGAQFQHPYVFKTLFSKEPIKFEDMCETKQVSTALYLDFEVEKPSYEMDSSKKHFVGRTGLFCPVYPETGGGALYRIKDDKFYTVAGTKGYLWKEAEVVKATGQEDTIDNTYFDGLCSKAIQNISQFGDFKEFAK